MFFLIVSADLAFTEMRMVNRDVGRIFATTNCLMDRQRETSGGVDAFVVAKMFLAPESTLAAKKSKSS